MDLHDNNNHQVQNEIFRAHYLKIIQNLVYPTFIQDEKKMFTFNDSQYKGKHVGSAT